MFVLLIVRDRLNWVQGVLRTIFLRGKGASGSLKKYFDNPCPVPCHLYQNGLGRGEFCVGAGRDPQHGYFVAISHVILFQDFLSP